MSQMTWSSQQGHDDGHKIFQKMILTKNCCRGNFCVSTSNMKIDLWQVLDMSDVPAKLVWYFILLTNISGWSLNLVLGYRKLLSVKHDMQSATQSLPAAKICNLHARWYNAKLQFAHKICQGPLIINIGHDIMIWRKVAPALYN